ncbi:hypothetical protein [Luethyella okanaganae]|uniref:Uncharacterized protein n=1 Tax=Luethyella okanaganae TaxID=69372 RepID=A0ABW1VFF8_9MICO
MPFKVDYFVERYAAMRRGVQPHPYHIDETTCEELLSMDFVFLAADGGRTKKLFGFYADLEQEHYSAYTIDGNHLLNEDQPE